MKKLALILVAFGVMAFATAPRAGELTDNVVKQARYYGVGWQSDGSHWSIELLIQKGADPDNLEKGLSWAVCERVV